MAAAKKTIKLTQKFSAAGSKPGVKETLAGLGLGRRDKTRELEDTPAVRGMVNRVKHLVDVDGETRAQKTK
jgi:large subunit ribosomal protein L30